MSIKTLSADFGFYGLLNTLQRSVSIIMVPIYTRVLSQAEYGNLDIIIVFSSVLCVLVDLQFVAGFSRLYYKYRNEGKDKRFVGTVIMSRLVGGIGVPAIFLIVGFLGNIEPSFLPSLGGNASVWLLAAISVPLTLTYDVLLLQTRMLRWKRLFGLGALSNSLLSVAFSIFFVVALRWGILGVVLGLVLGKIVSVLLLGWGLRREVEARFDVGAFKELIRYSMPLVPGWWFAFGSTYMGRFFVFAELGSAESAIMAVCVKVAGIIGLFSTSFHLAWQPLAMAYIGDESGEVFYVRSMRLFIAGGLFCVFFLAAFAEPILAVLAPSSYGVVKYYFPLFAVGSLLSGTANNLQLGNQIAKTTYWISISSISCVAINAAILIVFTKSYGIVAAGLAWVISFAVKNVVMYVSAQRNYYISYDKKAFLLLGLGCGLLLLLGLGNYVQYLRGWVFTSCAASLGILLPWYVMAPSEREALKEFVRQRLVRHSPR